MQNVEKEKQEPEEELQGTSLFHQCMSLRRLTHSEEDMVRKISHVRRKVHFTCSLTKAYLVNGVVKVFEYCQIKTLVFFHL